MPAMDDTELIQALVERARKLRQEAAALDAAVLALTERAAGIQLQPLHRMGHVHHFSIGSAFKDLQKIVGDIAAPAVEPPPERGSFTDLVYRIVRGLNPTKPFTAPDIALQIEMEMGPNAPAQLGTRVATVLNRMVDRKEIIKIEDGAGRKPHQYVKDLSHGN